MVSIRSEPFRVPCNFLPQQSDPLAYTQLRSSLPWETPELNAIANLSWLNSVGRLSSQAPISFSTWDGSKARHRNPLAFFTSSLPWEVPGLSGNQKGNLGLIIHASHSHHSGAEGGGWRVQIQPGLLVRLCCQKTNNNKPRPKQNKGKAPQGV